MKKIAIAGAFLVALVFAFLFGRSIPYADQWIVYDGLRQTASIMFGVFGAWLAIVYKSDIVDRLIGKNSGDKDVVSAVENDCESFKHVFHGVAFSSSLVALILVLGIIAPVIKRIPFFVVHAGMVRSLSFCLILSLTVGELYVILLSLAPMDQAYDRIKRALNLTNALRK